MVKPSSFLAKNQLNHLDPLEMPQHFNDLFLSNNHLSSLIDKNPVVAVMGQAVLPNTLMRQNLIKKQIVVVVHLLKSPENRGVPYRRLTRVDGNPC